ncbi:hypothetical protein HPT25_03650 [Bacillus sp. BRMEA1]|uniref:hypothetical protein n=1 Tax=Neobacillus endophyticus TaxID=2738405 RepID=UPI0015652225|nr:hypothetical protein [Neobacillus endophyticus]NRD76585.1 hypothetical protein [Neobacillus endophyticus]
MVVKFSCHSEVVGAYIESYKEMYSEQGYELLDNSIEKGSMFARVKLLIRPIREAKESK